MAVNEHSEAQIIAAAVTFWPFTGANNSGNGTAWKLPTFATNAKVGHPLSVSIRSSVGNASTGRCKQRLYHN
jgi:hypothetical protein